MQRLWLALLLVGCTGAEADPKGPLIRISGSDTMTRKLLPALAEGYQRTHPDLRFEFASSGSDKPGFPFNCYRPSIPPRLPDDDWLSVRAFLCGCWGRSSSSAVSDSPGRCGFVSVLPEASADG